MLAESIPSMADTGNQALLALGGRRGRQAPTAAHPFGLGRARYFWAFLVAVVLFALGSLFALFEGYEKLRHPHGIESPAWAFGALVVAIALESWSLRTAVHEADKVRAGLSCGRSSAVPRVPSFRLSCLRMWGAARAGLRTGRGEPGGGHRRVPLRRGRERRDRAAARRHRGDPGDRDAQPAHWRGGQPGRGGRHWGGTHRRSGGPPADPSAHLAAWSRRAAGRGQGRVRPGAVVGRGRRGDRRGRAARAGRGPVRADHLPRAGLLPGRSAGRTSLGPRPLIPSQLGRSSTETALFLLDRPK